MYHVSIKIKKCCTYGVQKIKKRLTLHHVDLTYMGKFHVRNVNESRDFQYLRVVVLKDVAPCGGLCPKSFIEEYISP